MLASSVLFLCDFMLFVVDPVAGFYPIVFHLPRMEPLCHCPTSPLDVCDNLDQAAH
jgi:hypothetical protein